MIKLDTIKSKQGNLSEIFISEFINWAKAYIIFGDQKVSQQHLRDPSNCHISLKSRILAFNIECSQSTVKGHDWMQSDIYSCFIKIKRISMKCHHMFSFDKYLTKIDLLLGLIWGLREWVLALISNLMTLISGFNVSKMWVLSS